MTAVAAAVDAKFPAFHLHPSVLLVAAGLELGYFLLLRRLAAPGEVATRPQKILWSAGVFTILVGAAWPMHDLAERYLYSMHMVQHMLFTLVAPPLLLLGTPAWLARKLLRPQWLFATVKTVSRPFIALVLFNTTFLFTHWPTLVTDSLRSEPLHFVLHLVVFFTALAMWMPVLSPLPEIPRLGPAAQMLYLFLQSILPTVPASFLTLSDGVIYKIYATFPRLWGLSAIDDQRIAGLTMKLVGGLILWGFIAAVFFRWANREQWADRQARQRGLTRMPSDGAVLTWEQVQAEFDRVAPAPAPEDHPHPG